jgi:hypothetical protein
MAEPPSDARPDRKKLTLWLLAGAGASLVLPLLGVLYLHFGESKPVRPPDGSVMFDRRERGESKVVLSQTVTAGPAPSAAGGGSSLDFVKGTSEFQEKPAEASTRSAAVPAAKPQKAQPAAKSAKKPLNRPRLQPTDGFSSYGARKKKAATVDGADVPPDVQKLLEGAGK